MVKRSTKRNCATFYSLIKLNAKANLVKVQIMLTKHGKIIDESLTWWPCEIGVGCGQRKSLSRQILKKLKFQLTPTREF